MTLRTSQQCFTHCDGCGTDEMTRILANVVVEARKVADRLEAAIEAARDLTREAHGATGDIQRATREARRAVPELAAEKIETEIGRQLKLMQSATREAMDQAVAKVFAEFDKLTDTLMGRDAQTRRAGEKSLPELAAARSQRDHGSRP